MTDLMQSGPLASTLAGRKFAVLLLAHGTPEAVDEVPEYLNNVVSGRAISQAVVEEIQHRYAQIGKSPLTEWTLLQAELLQEKIHVPVYVGMRNWKPYIADAVRKMRDDGVTDAVAICLAPQNSRTSVGLYRRAAYAESSGAVRFHFIESWAGHPRLADAFAERLRPAWQLACAVVGASVPVLFTAHSVPCRTVLAQQPLKDAEPESHLGIPEENSAGTVRPTAPERSYAKPANSIVGPDPYAVESKQTARVVAERLALDGLAEQDWYFAFQSQGMSGGPPGSGNSWIGPTVEDTLRALREQGHRAVVLQPIGFLCDHVEILYDIDIAFQALARKLDIQMFRPQSLNDSPLLIEALADLAFGGFSKLTVASSGIASRQ